MEEAEVILILVQIGAVTGSLLGFFFTHSREFEENTFVRGLLGLVALSLWASVPLTLWCVPYSNCSELVQLGYWFVLAGSGLTTLYLFFWNVVFVLAPLLILIGNQILFFGGRVLGVGRSPPPPTPP